MKYGKRKTGVVVIAAQLFNIEISFYNDAKSFMKK